MSKFSFSARRSNIATDHENRYARAASDRDPAVDQGVYVSLETLLDLRHSAYARPAKSAARVHDGLPGEIISSRKGAGIEFEDIRPYLPGDDLRHIDWRVAARTGKPFTRRYTEDKERSVMIVCDQRVNMFFGSGACFKSYIAAIAAAKIAWFALQKNHRLGGVIASESLQEIATGKPKRGVLTLCNSLVNHNRSITAESQHLVNLDEMLSSVTSCLKPGMIVTVISDFNDLDRSAALTLSAIAKHGVLMLRQIVDPLETAMLVRGYVGISDGKQVKQVVVSEKVREAYRKKRALINQRLSELVLQSAATLLVEDTGTVT